MKRFLNKLERLVGRLYIGNLILIVTVGSFAVFALDFVFGGGFSSLIALDPSLVLQGQAWRLVTFVFVPNGGAAIFVILALYFNYIVSQGLGQFWGYARVNLYYLVGMLATIAASFATGVAAGGYYLNITLFMAFAFVAGDTRFYMFFLIPVKAKWLAWLECALLAFQFVQSDVPGKIMLAAPFVNFLLFCGGELPGMIRGRAKSTARKASFQRALHEAHRTPRRREPAPGGAAKRDAKVVRASFHRCEVCGATEVDHPDLEFRYCSKCAGNHEYCMDHLRDHEHHTS